MDDDVVEFLAARYAEEWGRARDQELAAGLSESRATRDIEAKRDTLAAYLACRRAQEAGDDTRWRAGQVDALRAVVEGDAAVYSDHPGYRPEWKP